MMIITTQPDVNVDPGHQWLVLPDSDQGYALALILAPHMLPKRDMEGNLLIPHTHLIDTHILELINALAHVRFSAPGLVQISLPMAPAVNEIHTTEDDGDLEGA